MCAHEAKAVSYLGKSVLCRKATAGPPGLTIPDFSLTEPDIRSLWNYHLTSLARVEPQLVFESKLVLFTPESLAHTSIEHNSFLDGYVGILQAIKRFQTAIHVALFLFLLRVKVFGQQNVGLPWLNLSFVFLCRHEFRGWDPPWSGHVGIEICGGE